MNSSTDWNEAHELCIIYLICVGRERDLFISIQRKIFSISNVKNVSVQKLQRIVSV
jgi:hypothetical protein